MSDSPLPPLNWEGALSQLDTGASASAESNNQDQDDEADSGVFLWPTPPFAIYPPARRQTEHETCEIEGLNGRIMKGRLSFFVPDEEVAHIQVPPSRTTMALRFGQFRTLLLTAPLKPKRPADELDPHASMLDHRASVPYKVKFKAGGEIEGETVGHRETEFGIFLFPPVGDDGSVQRLFVGREVLGSFEVGGKIGELLVTTQAVTQEQVEQAVEVQNQLRNQKLGDILLTQHVVSADQLLAAIEQQSKMPMVRIGEALIALGLIDQAQLEDALERQKRDRSVPLGELLVGLGLVSRHDLQTALARKMGYPLVDLEKFPIEADALRKVPFAVAHRLMAVPLLLRDGNLVAAVEDPSKRLTLSELEFITQCKIVPVLAQHTQLEFAIKDAYSKIGADVSADSYGRASAQNQSGDFDMEPQSSGSLMEDLEKQNQESHAEDEKPIEQSDNSLVRLINTMIIEAHAQGVSDIHVESYPGKEKIKIRFRKDGVLMPYLELPPNYRSAMIARIKIMCDLDISERRKPQDG
ncbi:MAG: pilus assembly protein PilB, partial [Rubrivivax sp.]